MEGDEVNGNGSSQDGTRAVRHPLLADGRALMRSLFGLLGERSRLAGRIGSYEGENGAYKRDLFESLGYATRLTTRGYAARFERGGIARRIVEAAPRATWSGGADLQEDPDVEVSTPFEAAVEELWARLDVWARLQRADILAGLGSHAAILIGAPDGIETELGRLSGPDNVLYLTPLSQANAEVESWADDPADERFGLPDFYTLKLGAGASSVTRRAHWSRVVHVAEGVLEDDVTGEPRLRAVWNYLDDLDKVVGGGAEASWVRAHPGLHMNLDPAKMAGKISDVEEEKFQQEVEEYLHGMSRVLRTRGMDVTMMDVTVTAFGQNADTILKLISATTGIPHRILTGSERGELASSQDRSNWNDRIAERRREFAEPLVRQLVDRLVAAGALPEPKQYEIVWPDNDELTEEEKAAVIGKIASANLAQYQAEGTVVVPANEMRDRVYGLDPLEEPEPEEEESPTATLPEEEGETPEERAAAEAGPDEPEWRAIHRAADRNRNRIMALFLAFWAAMSGRIDAEELERALRQNNRTAAVRIVNAAIEATEREFAQTLPDQLLDVLSDGARAALATARARGSWLRTAAAAGARWDEVEFRAAFTFSFDEKNPRAIDWARQGGSKLITEIGPETRKAIAAMIAQGLEQGIPPRRLMRVIQARIGLRSDQVRALARFTARPGVTQAAADRYAKKLLRDRATLIARTETMRAANAGQRELWRQAQEARQIPVDQKRVWLATMDNATREEHAFLHGEVVGIDEPFSGGYEPGEEPNCRCAQGLATPEDLERAKARGEVATPPPAPAGEPDPNAPWGGGFPQGGDESRAGMRNFLDLDGASDPDNRRAWKEKVVEDIKRRMKANGVFTGVYDDAYAVSQVDDLVRSWALTSGDSEPMAIAMQLAAVEEFGLSAARLTHFGAEYLDRARAVLVKAPASRMAATNRDLMRGFLRAQYGATQEFFKRHKITHLNLVRGAEYDDFVTGFGKVHLQPLSSFTVDSRTASYFGEFYHASRVPVSEVLSNPMTGVGCLNEFEFVVLGKSHSSWTWSLDELLEMFPRAPSAGWKDSFGGGPSVPMKAALVLDDIMGGWTP